MNIEHQILIHAAPETVWRITVNVARWPEWTPTVRSARALTEGPLALGSRYAVKQPLQPEAQWEVTDCLDGQSFSWETRGARQVLRATHRLEAHAEGTLNTLILEAPGLTGVLRRPVLRILFRAALSKENAGLKAFCEQVR